MPVPGQDASIDLELRYTPVTSASITVTFFGSYASWRMGVAILSARTAVATDKQRLEDMMIARSIRKCLHRPVQGTRRSDPESPPTMTSASPPGAPAAKQGHEASPARAVLEGTTDGACTCPQLEKSEQDLIALRLKPQPSEPHLHVAAHR